MIGSGASTTLTAGRRRRAPAGQFEDVQPGIGAVDDVDVAALVGLDIVGLDRDLAAFLAVDRDAALVGRRGDRRNEMADLLGVIGIADVERAHAGIEEGDESHLL